MCILLQTLPYLFELSERFTHSVTISGFIRDLIQKSLNSPRWGRYQIQHHPVLQYHCAECCYFLGYSGGAVDFFTDVETKHL
ncbi:hypothetical protein CHARACLAT_028660 [Characodon lateralis]|uniref:Uncharacterized protein n=1 Tax=Characodon lateralis TaxID=208331 RepID=A0ABU7CSL4_9TELE|nr:hypothetical protein [Characodon lateralis]